MGGPGFQRAVTDALPPRGTWRADPDVASPDGVSQGSPLSGSDQAFFGAAFDRDFSRVRVHADRGAAASAAQARAHAYTVGDHVFFADGRYAPATQAGRRLLAHELAHVVQQGRGSGPGQADDAGAHLDADRAGRRAAEGRPATVTEARPAGMARQPADDAPAPAAAPADAQAQAPAQAPAPAPADGQAPAQADAGTRIEQALIRRLMGALVPGEVAVPVVVAVVRGMVHQLAAEHAGSTLWANLLTITPKGIAQVLIGYEAGGLEGLLSPIGDLFGLAVFEEQVEAMARQVLISILKSKGDLSGAAEALATEAAGLAEQIAHGLASLKDRPAKETIADILELPDALAGVAVQKGYDFGVQAGKDIAAALEAPWQAEQEHKPAPSFLEMPATWTQAKYEELTGRLFSTPWLKVGRKIGYAVGWVAIQVVLLLFTEGIGNAIEKVGAAVGRIGEVLGGLSEVAGKGAAKVAEFFTAVGKGVSILEEVVGLALKKLLKPLEPLLRPVMKFLEDLEGFLRKLLGIPERDIAEAAEAAARKAARAPAHDEPPALPKGHEPATPPPPAHKPPEHAPPPEHKPPDHVPPPEHKPPEHVPPPSEHKPPEHAVPKRPKRAKKPAKPPAEPKPPESGPPGPKPRKREAPARPLTATQARKLAAVERERRILIDLENKRVTATNDLDRLLSKPKRAPGEGARIERLQKDLEQLDSKIEEAEGRLERADTEAARAMRTPFEEFRDAVDSHLAGRKVAGEVGPLKVPPRTPRPTQKDHIVSVREMWDMDGFRDLPVKDRVEIANISENLINMDGVANASKGQQPWRAWRQASNFYGPETIERMKGLESKLRPKIEAEIQRRLAGLQASKL
jgi:hypothetical protein